MTRSHDPALARAAWEQLQQAGGLVGVDELRTRWGGPGRPLQRGRVQTIVDRPGFPDPVMTGARGHLWISAEVDAWRRADLARPGRRGPRPRSEGRQS